MKKDTKMLLRRSLRQDGSMPGKEAVQKLIERSVQELRQTEPKPRKSPWKIALAQICFAGWKVYLAQILILCAGLIMGRCLLDGIRSLSPVSIIRALSLVSVMVSLSMLPFLYRSARYSMLEVESAAWLSGRRLMLIRAALLFIGDILLVLVVSVMAILRTGLEAWTAVSSAGLPMLVIFAGLLYLIRKTDLTRFGQRFAMLCGGIAAGMQIICRQMLSTWLITAQAALCAILLLVCGLQIFEGLRNNGGTIYA